MNIWYTEDGRHSKDHPMHGLFTGLAELARAGKLAGVSADTFQLDDLSSNEMQSPPKIGAVDLKDSLDDFYNHQKDWVNGKQIENQFGLEDSLDLRDFFEAYEKGNPYMMSAISELHSAILERAPEFLSKKSSWFKSWMWAGKKKL